VVRKCRSRCYRIDGALCDAVGVSRRPIRFFLVLVAALATGGYAAASAAKEVAPFTYKFQVVSVTLKATFTKGSATATTELHLSSPPKQKSLSWWGKKNHSNANGGASAVIRLAGTATYSGLEQPCNVTVTLDSSRWRPVFASLGLINARDPVVTHPMISAAAGRFPLATIYRRRGGGCENGTLPWYEGGTADLPLRVVRQATFSFSASYNKDFEDGAALEWTVTMKVRKIHYRLLDCARTPLC
jgi:hypothetical protein